MPSATLLLTRPKPDSQRFAALFPDMPVVIAPILRIVPVAHDAARATGAGAYAFTSVHAVAAAGPGRGRPALCVGPHTADVARAAGFDVTQGSGDAIGLRELVADSPVPLLYLRGRHMTRDLGVASLVVYDQQAQGLTAEAGDLLAGDAPVILPVFSARSAQLLSDAIGGEVRAPLYLAAISEAVLAGWRHKTAASLIAPTPDAEGMRSAVIRLLSREQ